MIVDKGDVGHKQLHGKVPHATRSWASITLCPSHFGHKVMDAKDLVACDTSSVVAYVLQGLQCHIACDTNTQHA